METTQIYDILLTILNNGTEKLFKQLGVTDIPSGEKKLQTLDSAEVRDLYEAIRPTPKPRKKIRRIKDLFLLERTDGMKAPSARAIHDFLPIWQEKFHNFDIKNIEDMISCYFWTREKADPYLPKSYDKFYKHKNGTVKPKQKEKVIEILREYMFMKKYEHPEVTENKTQIAVYGHRTRSKDDHRLCNKYFKRITDDFGIYHILDYMTDKNKNGIYNFLSHKGKISWHYR